MTAVKPPRGALTDAPATSSTEPPRGALTDAPATSSTERPRGGSSDARAPRHTDDGWAAPPLAPPKPRTPHQLGGHGPGREEADRRDHDREDAKPLGPARADALRAGPERTQAETLRRDGREIQELEPGSRVMEPEPSSLVTAERLAEFFAPRRIAVVGASPASAWARFLLASAAAIGFTGDLIPVHPRHKTVFGKPAVASLRDLREPADLAFIMVPTAAAEQVLEDAGAAGVRGAVVLASGYRETGAEGRALEDRLVARAAAHGITLLGPNCLGFLNTHARSGPFALTVPCPLLAGPVGIALQSGALASVMLSFARWHAIGVSTLASLGNEAMITTPDVMDYLVDDESTRVICLFLEQISDPGRFAAAAERADRAGKSIIALKAGSSAAGSQAALAHTGSIAGDDAVVDAVLRQLNVIRVTSIEELLSTGALLGYGRRPEGRRMGVLTASGGACDIIADRAAAQGIEIPPFAQATAAAIQPHVPPFAQVRNPLDVTGYFLANQRTSALTAIDHALDAAVEDPALDFVYFSGLTLPDVRPSDETMASMLEERVTWLGQRMVSSPIPVVPVGYTCVDVTEYGAGLLAKNDIYLLGGMELGIQAIGNAIRWAEGRGRIWPGPVAPAATTTTDAVGVALAADAASAASAAGVWREADARELLTSFGVPVVPAELVASTDAAAAAAKRLGYPVALRISSAEITHKSDIGGVALGLGNITQLRSGFKRVHTAGEASAAADIDGVMVSPMRSGGVELLAGVSVDPVFGPVLAVGLGGIWVEVLADVSLRALPVGADEVIRMLGELRGTSLLRGARGRRPAGMDALAAVVVRIAEAALSLGGSLRALEVNPLWVDGDQIEALDVLVVADPPDHRPPHRRPPGQPEREAEQNGSQT
jgi:acetate---CoA ligase (ADP-forming)